MTNIEERLLLSAYSLGYFEIPRRVTLEELVRIHDVSKMAVNIHLRSAIRKLVDHYIRSARPG
ncbi:helix-turn-helix domain-containing protein [Vulcanisaeta thermophila]|uniref:helix-turn-helix domain-containing protein n=1 Tax=Vulcanisaeta thermophila TaxID=867917 RepID=UPI000852F950|nr:helix-turn-helix domain-containing protein [Vulcanisaeta thermophila]